MSIYAKILKIRQQLPPFTFDRMEGNVKFISDEQINTKLVPLLNAEGIDTIPHGEIIDNHYKHTIEFVDVESGERFESCISWPIDKRNFEFGSTVTLADKYVYLKLFKINTGEENGRALVPINEQDKASGKEPFMTLVTKEDEILIPDITTVVDEQVFEEITTSSADPLKNLLNTVAKEEQLKPIEDVVKPDKKEEEPSELLMNKINEGGWKIQIPLHLCLNELKAQEGLDKLYANLGTMLYGHVDNDLCPINPYKVIDKLARRSNLKIRRAIVQFRLYGEEAFWKQLTAETSLSKDEIEAKLASPIEPPKEEDIKPIVHKLKLDFEIPEHMGVDRDEEVVFGILQNLIRIGVTKFTIIYALGKMKEKPVITAVDDDEIISQFLSKGSLLQIEEMIKLAKGAG